MVYVIPYDSCGLEPEDILNPASDESAGVTNKLAEPVHESEVVLEIVVLSNAVHPAVDDSIEY